MTFSRQISFFHWGITQNTLGLQWSKSLGHLKCWNFLPKFWCCNLGDAQKNSDPLMRMSKEFVKRYCKIYFQDVALRGMDLPMSFPPNYFDAFIDVVHYEDTLLPLWPQWHISCKKKNKATISWKVCNPHIADINSNFCQELLHEPLPHDDMAPWYKNFVT